MFFFSSVFTLSFWNLARVLNPMSWKTAPKLKISLFCNFLCCPVDPRPSGCSYSPVSSHSSSCYGWEVWLLLGVGALSFLTRPSLSLSMLCCDCSCGIGLVVRRAGSGRFYSRFVSWGGESPASSVSKGAGPALHWERQAISASSEGSGNLKI